MKGEKKVEKVMGEFKRGDLKSSSGETVTDRDQAVAIAMSEADMSNDKKSKKKYAGGGKTKMDGCAKKGKTRGRMR